MSNRGSRPSSRRTSMVVQSTNPSPPHAGPTPPSQSLNTAMQALAIPTPSRSLPSRPAPGKAGKALTVMTNHFRLNASQFPEAIYKWNVVIRREPSNQTQPQATISGRVKRRVLELLLRANDFNRGVYTDYEKTLFSFNQLTPSQNEPRVVQVDYYEPEEQNLQNRPYQVVFQVVIESATIPLPSQPLKELLNDQGIIIDRASEYEEALNVILLRYAGQNPDLTTAARGTKVFPLSGDSTCTQLTRGLIARRGYSRRVRILQGGLKLCVNSTASVMYEETSVSDLISKWRPPQALRQPKPETHRIRMLEEFLKGLRVQAKFGRNRVKPILGLAHTNPTGSQDCSLQGAAQCMFRCDTHPISGVQVNRQVSVQWWFQEAYQKRINPKGILLNVGSKTKPIYWPAELCWVQPGQSYKRLLPFTEQAQQMIKFACRAPAQNIELIQREGLSMLGIQAPGAATAGTVMGSPLQVWMSMETTPARRLPGPQLQLMGKPLTRADTSTGQWNLSDRRFKQGAITAYTVLVIGRQGEPSISNLNEFKNALARQIKAYCDQQAPYITFPHLPADAITWPQRDQLAELKALFNQCGQAGVRYCFIIPSDPKWYKSIKVAADAVGMQTTITLRNNNTVKANPGAIANLLLKYNLKCGGINWALNPADFKILRGRKTMFLGADVVHPPPGAMDGAPSCAALVASVNPDPAQFPGMVVLQSNPETGRKAQEIILNLDSMVESRLTLWKQRNNGHLPELLVMYRDGVSDEQLQQVLDGEVPLMAKACKKIYGAANQPLPRLIWQVCQKRQIARIYQPQGDKSRAFDSSGNPLPGLVVDQGIVSTRLHDWYAVSHKCIQGTSVPTHHYLVYDETNADPDDIQALTFGMSYVFGRSVTSISVPAPARLADRLCERAKYHLHEVYFPQQYFQNPEDFKYDPNKYFRGQHNIHPRIADTMYYI